MRRRDVRERGHKRGPVASHVARLLSFQVSCYTIRYDKRDEPRMSMCERYRSRLIFEIGEYEIENPATLRERNVSLVTNCINKTPN